MSAESPLDLVAQKPPKQPPSVQNLIAFWSRAEPSTPNAQNSNPITKVTTTKILARGSDSGSTLLPLTSDADPAGRPKPPTLSPHGKDTEQYGTNERSLIEIPQPMGDPSTQQPAQSEDFQGM
jgi:hypothetical protein